MVKLEKKKNFGVFIWAPEALVEPTHSYATCSTLRLSWVSSTLGLQLSPEDVSKHLKLPEVSIATWALFSKLHVMASQVSL